MSSHGTVYLYRGVCGMTDRQVAVTIYHNPACGTSRNTLALIRNAGIEPTVIEYLKTPPDRATLEDLLKRMGMRPRELLRDKGTHTPSSILGLTAGRMSSSSIRCSRTRFSSTAR